MEPHKKFGEGPFLDSGGVCFLCLKLPSELPQAVKSTKRSSLLKISRYLQIDIDIIFPEIFINSNLDKRNNEVFVSLCVRCSSVYNLFDELYTILEETELLMKGCINKIHKIIQNGQINPIRWEELKQTPSVGRDSKTMESLRKRIMLKCERNLKFSAPRVVLRRLSDNEMKRLKLKISSQSSIQTISSRILIKREPDQDLAEVNDIISEDSSPAIELNDDASNSNSYSDTMVLPPSDIEFNLNQLNLTCSESSRPSNKNKVRGSVSTSDYFSCPYCDFKGDWGRLSALTKHLGRDHVEHFFPNLFPKVKMTLMEFHKLVEKHVKSFIKNDNCSLCNKKYNCTVRSVRFFHVKVHLLTEHGPELEKSLIERLSLTNPPAIKREEVNEVIPESAAAASSPNLKKIMEDIKNLKCPYCPFKGKTRVRLYHHLGSIHPEHYLPNVREQLKVSPKEFKAILDFGVKKFIKEDNCALCDKKYMLGVESEQFRHIKIHLLQEHTDILEEKILEIGRSPELLEKLNSKPEASSSVQGTEVNVFENSRKSRHMCRHCGRKFSSANTVRHHILFKHKDAYFSSMKKENVTDSQYKLIIDYLIFNDFIKNLRCTLCSMKPTSSNKYWQASEVKSHLIDKHREKLIEKLKEIQNDPVIMSQVSKSTQGCLCGQLFPARGEMLKHAISCEFRMSLRGKQIPCSDCGAMIFRKGMTRHKEESCKVRKVKKLLTRKPIIPKRKKFSRKEKCLRCGKLLNIRSLPRHRNKCPGMKRSKSRSESKMEVDVPVQIAYEEKAIKVEIP